MGSMLGFIFILAVAVIHLCLVIAAAISISKHERLTDKGKTMWGLGIGVAPVIGSIMWFAWGRSAEPEELYKPEGPTL